MRVELGCKAPRGAGSGGAGSRWLRLRRSPPPPPRPRAPVPGARAAAEAGAGVPCRGRGCRECSPSAPPGALRRSQVSATFPLPSVLRREKTRPEHTGTETGMGTAAHGHGGARGQGGTGRDGTVCRRSPRSPRAVQCQPEPSRAEPCPAVPSRLPLRWEGRGNACLRARFSAGSARLLGCGHGGGG